MTKDVAQNWHEKSSIVANSMTVRLGGPFTALCEWAVKRELQLPLEIGYHILGLDQFTVGIGNLVHELMHPESLTITAEWDANPIVHELRKFAEAVKADAKIDANYSNIAHLGGASKNKKQFKNYASKTFLLTLITNPLADTTDEITYSYRRRLRIWLLVQAASRLIDFNSPADKSISSAARYLVMEAVDENWKLVDELLRRTQKQMGRTENTFERFTTALANAAGALRHDSLYPGKTNQQFLNSVASIANGEYHPLDSSTTYISAPPHLRYVTQTIDAKPFDDDELTFNIAPSFDDEEPLLSYITDIDPTDSPAQQALSSGSIYIQAMELSHYLPWSWDRVLPTEVEALESWIDNLLKSTDTVEQVGSVMVWLAMHLSRSLTLVERITVNNDLTEEWSISPDFQFLKRTPPRRRSAWRPNEETQQQVEAFRDDLTITVPQQIEEILRLAVQSAENTHETLGQIWQSVTSKKLDTWFNEQAKTYFPRLTSTKLANYQAQRLFDAKGEFNFARLLASHPNSALPGACSYATWDIKAIEQGLQLPALYLDSSSSSTNSMGSLLAPLESVLCDEIERCNSSIQQAFAKGLIQYHNALAQYVVMALYAATGARPLRDPFESFQHFSFKHCCVFINDKNDEGLHNGRLVPLPKKIITLLTYYLQSLNILNQQVAEHSAELALQISNLIDGREANMPLFFLLDNNLRWHSMADAAQLGCTLFEWSLPANLFRHRYSQRLLKEGVDPEVIEGWMGHAERGTATYSDYSARCWNLDAKNYQCAVENSYHALPFSTPVFSQKPPPLFYLPAEAVNYSEPKLFGQRARARHRTLRIKAAIREVRTDISLFLNERTLQELSDDELLLLSNRMLLRENRLPHPQAALRFRVLVKELQKPYKSEFLGEDANAQACSADDIETETSTFALGYARRQLLRKRLVTINDERTHITPAITSALELYTQLSSWAETVRKNALKAGLAKARALCLGTLLLAIEKRLGYKQLLQDLIAGNNFRLLQNKRQFFLEYSETLEVADFSAAVQRHEISYKTASLLADGIHKKKETNTPLPSIMGELKGLLEIYTRDNPANDEPTLDELLSWLCSIINQANLVQLPGIVAAALSERAPPTSSSLRDHERLLNGRALDLPSDSDDDTEWPNSALARTRNRASDKLSLQRQANELAKDIAIELQAYAPAHARQCALKLRSICDGYQGKVSPSMMLLGYWIADLSATGKAKKRKKIVPYARNSLTTYWGSLSSAFRSLLYEVDLVTQDTEEVTELCAQMLDYKFLSSKHADYFGKRLKDFFRWAARFGVATPEWTELDLDSGYRTVSPGLISESEYQECLKRILADNTLTQDEQLMLGFVLLATYRFGLRSKEAIGMLRRDWCQHDLLNWVLVQSNQYRTLKSQASRRAIPLLFKLSANEKDIVERTLARYASIAGKQLNRPILCEASGSDRGQPVLTSLAPRISEALIRLLRSVTGNPSLVLHHCRHSFYNRVAPALFGLGSPLAGKLSNTAEHDEISRIVLGPINHVSRRGAMALARLMGHRFPSTGLKNYCHLITEWADDLTPVTHLRARKIKSVFQVSEQPTVPKLPFQNIAKTLSHPSPTLAKILQTLRLASLGMSYERAGELMQVRPQHISILQNTIEQTNARMRFSLTNNRKVKLKGEDCPNALLESLSDGAWQRLLHHAEKLKDTAVYAKDDEVLEHLDDLPYLISPNRHVLMEQPAHCSLVKHVVRLFEIPVEQYKVIAKDSSLIAVERLSDAGFEVTTECEAGIKLDGFTVFLPERGSQYRLSDYGGLVLSRTATGLIRNSYELTISLLACGVLAQLNA